MSVRHHPADAILAAYAAGSLRPGFDIVCAAHLESCPRCRSHVRLFQDAAGGLLSQQRPVELSAEALPRMMARLEREPAPQGEVHRDRDRRPIAERLPVKRRRWLGPGLWVQPIDIPQRPGDRAYFLRVPAGLRGIEHSHTGTEFTVVLKGALKDEGEVYRAGDFVECDDAVHHQPSAGSEDGGCLCLIATEGSLVTKDWFSNLIRSAAGV